MAPPCASRLEQMVLLEALRLVSRTDQPVEAYQEAEGRLASQLPIKALYRGPLSLLDADLRIVADYDRGGCGPAQRQPALVWWANPQRPLLLLLFLLAVLKVVESEGSASRPELASVHVQIERPAAMVQRAAHVPPILVHAARAQELAGEEFEEDQVRN